MVAVHQLPVVTTALGHDVIMPCHLSSKVELRNTPVLYWVDNDNAKLWPPSEKYKERVDLLDQNSKSSNHSIILKNVQWADSGKYVCKLSIITTDTSKRSRIKGNETLLIIYGEYKIYNVRLVLIRLKLMKELLECYSGRSEKSQGQKSGSRLLESIFTMYFVIGLQQLEYLYQ